MTTAIDTALSKEGFNFNRSLLKTPEHRLSMALHWLDTDILNASFRGDDTSTLEDKYNRLKKLSDDN